jgi:hypothetical protein
MVCPRQRMLQVGIIVDSASILPANTSEVQVQMGQALFCFPSCELVRTSLQAPHKDAAFTIARGSRGNRAPAAG